MVKCEYKHNTKCDLTVCLCVLIQSGFILKMLSCVSEKELWEFKMWPSVSERELWDVEVKFVLITLLSRMLKPDCRFFMWHIILSWEFHQPCNLCTNMAGNQQPWYGWWQSRPTSKNSRYDWRLKLCQGLFIL